MRKIFQFFAVSLMLCSFAYAADDSSESSRGIQTAQRTSTYRSNSSQSTERAKARTTTTRPTQTGQQNSQRETATRQQSVSRTAVQSKVVGSATRTQKQSQQTSRRPSISRAAITSAATRATTNSARSMINKNRSRAAVTNKVIGSSISSEYTTCKNTYFSCMDEFCANKDASLRRCACSSRLHDFDKDKEILDKAQEKLADFNQRLLTVNMDKEDVEVIGTASEGENAYNVKDKSSSQKTLDAILNKINEKTTDTEQTQSLAALNLSSDSSQDMFDSVDSMMGEETTTKEGEALYKAALPVCLEMATEVCSDEDISLVKSAYTMSIEQDCNTLEKNYELLKSNAVSKTKEGSALLDMSRLTNYQDRNSKDLLTCTKEMIEVMNTDSVCGKDLGKCLDWTGKYIDPMTGSAILSPNLADLTSTLVEPSVNQKWIEVPANASMVEMLESKKTYIEPAMKNCETISTVVWDNFMEEALAKIKIEQNARLETMRQNCTSMIGKCKTETEKSIQNFDPRALSIFGVSADANVTKMCEDIQNACNALMRNNVNNNEVTTPAGDSQTGEDWEEGMKNVDAQKTYQTILQTCKLIGQECVQQQCRTGENQFELCTEKASSQRRGILSQEFLRNYCFKEVLDCVTSSTAADFDRIFTENQNDFLDNTAYAPDDTNQTKISKNIWGHCVTTNMTDKTNRIVMNTNTILGWFGQNTDDGCYTGYCPEDTYYIYEQFLNNEWNNQCDLFASSAYEYCGAGMEMGGIVGAKGTSSVITVHSYTEALPRPLVYMPDGHTGVFTNCCLSGVKDGYGNCCEFGMSNNTFLSGIIGTSAARPSGLCNPERQCCFEWDPANTHNGTTRPDVATGTYCKPDTAANWEYIATNDRLHLFCLGTLHNDKYGLPDSTSEKTCDGTFVTVDQYGLYRSKMTVGSTTNGIEKYINYYYDNISNSADAIDSHHMLYVYLYPNFFSSGMPSAAGYYRLSRDGEDIIIDQPANVKNPTQILYHRVSFCENGFWINASGGFGCCDAAEPCNTYNVK